MFQIFLVLQIVRESYKFLTGSVNSSIRLPFFPFLSEQTVRMRRSLAYVETLTGLNYPCHQAVGFCYSLSYIDE